MRISEAYSSTSRPVLRHIALCVAALLLLFGAAPSAAQNTDFATLLSGTGHSRVFSMTTDAAGNSYVVGETDATDFPIVGGAQSTLAGNYDAFVAKVDPGGILVFSTYFGGSGFDSGRGIVVGPDGNIYITGYTGSGNLPLVGPLDSSLGGGSDSFIAGFTSTGDTLLFSTYFGGDAEDNGEAIAADAAGNVYVAGRTRGGLALVNPAQPLFGGVEDAFVLKLDSTHSAYDYVTYLGGDQIDVALAIALDGGGRACVGGFSASGDFPAVHPSQALFGGVQDGFYSLLSSDGSTLELSSLLGGSGIDTVRSVACAPARTVVGGDTTSTDFPIVDNPGIDVQSVIGGDKDGFIAVYENAAGQPEFVTYRGGRRADSIASVAFEAGGGIGLAGDTASSDFPGLDGAVLNLHGAGIFRSNDGGASWQPSGLQGVTINGEAVVPGSPERVLAATDRGLFSSIDQGATWQAINDPYARRAVHAIDVDPLQNCHWTIGIDFAAADGATPVGGARSTDCGTSWVPWASPAIRITSVHRLTQNDRIVLTVDRVSPAGSGTLKDTCVVNDDGTLNRCLGRASSSHRIAVNPASPCEFYEGDEFGQVRRIAGALSCDHPFNDLSTGAAFGSAVTALEVAVPTDPLNTEVFAGTANGRIHSRSPAGIWSTVASNLPCRVSGLHNRGDNTLLASSCQVVTACTLGGGGCLAFPGGNRTAGFACFSEATGGLLACSAPTSDGVVGALNADGEFDVLAIGGPCSEESAAGSLTGFGRRLASTVTGECDGGGNVQSYGPYTPQSYIAVIGAARSDRIFRDFFEDLLN